MAEVTNEKLVVDYMAGDQKALEKLWDRIKGLAVIIARNYSKAAEMDDLMQEGFLGLCEAAKHFQDGTGMVFSSYAALWMRQKMLRYIENYGKTIRVPSGMAQIIRKKRRLEREYIQAVGQAPTEKELQCLLGVNEAIMDGIRRGETVDRVSSLDEPMKNTEDLSLIDTISDETCFEDEAERQADLLAMAKKLWEAVDALPPKQASVIRSRFKDNSTLAEAGERIGISASHAWSVERGALKKLCRIKEDNVIRSYREMYLPAAKIRHRTLSNFRRTWTSEVEQEAFRNLQLSHFFDAEKMQNDSTDESDSMD